jgi:hypothetical protein
MGLSSFARWFLARAVNLVVQAKLTLHFVEPIGGAAFGQKLRAPLLLMRKAAERIPGERLWVNPDCGLKTRQWEEVIPALAGMISAAKRLRSTISWQPSAQRGSGWQVAILPL